ncbi:flagellar biosynthetic protein FliO [Georgenia sp. 311]|uniref:Flagellar biosynthetic protein FliO n=1 Tax=Georgenia wutianyii TaxID=2585135 RepID=A0ABX5VJB2_9MICO|nr:MULTISPECIES: flagellar biosynthetic protein FliO [Georgenia]QDB78180.1 flagellar biosynthetic protein FliO [Georgenia wutianyii]TNC21244.1 flagellar biosynthetic protein FliO [Georgenia sp. 311]
MTDTLGLALRVALSLGVVLALLWFLARRVGAGAGTPRRLPITVLGRQTLGRRSGITVVDVAGRTLVLGVSDSEVRLLTELEPGPLTLLEDGDGGTPQSRPAAPLSGSVLAPGTWRTTWETLRTRTRG